MFSSKVEIPEEELISKEEMEKIELILGNAIKDAQNKLISNNIETKLQIDFLLREGSFIFSKSNLKNNILTSESFAFSYSDLSFSMRKGELFSNVESQLKSFNVELQTIINKYKTTLPITFLEESQRNTDFVFLFKFRQNAPKDEINSKLELTVNNLNLLYHQVFLERIIKFLTVDLNEDIVSKAWEKWYVIKEEASEELKKALAEELAEEKTDAIWEALEAILRQESRKLTLKGKRVDGRKFDETRKLFSEVGVLPRTHGSAIFQRGQTQVLTVATLGAPSLGQLIESAEGEESKHYLHHYSMPPFSTGEVGRIGSPSRREIGHGALAERALFPVIPAEAVFPYTIRLVSEVLSSNGSTSMAATCGSTLALMDAGVPITAPVSGIAMGLVVEGKDFVILTDINGMEDYLVGDMDFKVTGTEKGVTALQLDVKTLDLTTLILKEAFAQAKKGRAEILKSILATLPSAREKVSPLAPKIKVVKVPVEKIGEVIGPGGKMIKKIIAETGAEVEVEGDGSVNISGINEEAVNLAASRVEALVKEVKPGEIYEGEVKRIQPFGAFIEILPGKEGMVHVSDMSEGFVKDPNEVVSFGQKVKVRVKEIDDLGRINLSMRMDPSTDRPREPHFVPHGGTSRGSDSFGGPRRDFGRGPRREYSSRPRFSSGGRSGFARDDRSSGPHFPTSRLVSDKKDFGR